MAEVRIDPDDPAAGEDASDVEMRGGDDDDDDNVVEIGETAGAGAGGGEALGELPGAAVAEDEAAKSARVTFVDYLKSPIVEMAIGSGDAQTVLYAHQALLTRSPFFASRLEGGIVRFFLLLSCLPHHHNHYRIQNPRLV